MTEFKDALGDNIESYLKPRIKEYFEEEGELPGLDDLDMPDAKKHEFSRMFRSEEEIYNVAFDRSYTENVEDIIRIELEAGEEDIEYIDTVIEERWFLDERSDSKAASGLGISEEKFEEIREQRGYDKNYEEMEGGELVDAIMEDSSILDDVRNTNYFDNTDIHDIIVMVTDRVLDLDAGERPDVEKILWKYLKNNKGSKRGGGSGGGEGTTKDLQNDMYVAAGIQGLLPEEKEEELRKKVHKAGMRSRREIAGTEPDIEKLESYLEDMESLNNGESTNSDIDSNQITDEMLEWVLEDTREIKQTFLDEDSKLSDYIADTITVPGEDNEEKRFPQFYHAEGAKLVKDNKKFLLADEMGVGKSPVPVLSHYYIGEDEKTVEDMQSLIISPKINADGEGEEIESWVDKIEEYTSVEPDINVIESIDPDEVDPEADFNIINYGKLNNLDPYKVREGEEDLDKSEASFEDIDWGEKGDQGLLIERLIDVGFDQVAIDEAHAIKNDQTNQSMTIDLIAEESEYLSMLTGTPIRNELDDAFRMCSLLGDFDDMDEVKEKHRNRPRIVKNIISNKWRTLEQDDVYDTTELEELTEEEVPILDIESEFEGSLHEKVYNEVLSSDKKFNKVQELNRVAMDPNLAKLEYIESNELQELLRENEVSSEKYKAADKIVKGAKERDEKFVFFTTYNKGVIDKLEERWDADEYGGAIGVHGNQKRSEKIENIEEFQKSDATVMIATPESIGEGISFTEPNKVGFLNCPWTPGQKNQAIRRVYRRGQEEDVDVANLFIDGTIDQGIEELVEEKQDLIDYFMSGGSLTDDQVKMLNSGKFSKSSVDEKYYIGKRSYARMESIITKGMETTEILEHFKTDENIGTENEVPKGELYATGYGGRDWENSYSEFNGLFLKKILEAEDNKKDLKVADLGSAFGTIGELFKQDDGDLSPVNVDINEFHFKDADSRLKSRGTDGKNVVGNIVDLPLQNSSMDRVVSSLSLYHNSNSETVDEGITEREKALEEANRVLEEGGRYYVTVPASMVSNEVRDNLVEGLEKKGFELNQNLSGLVKGIKHLEEVDVEFTSYRSFLFTAEKTEGVYESEELGNKNESIESGIDDLLNVSGQDKNTPSSSTRRERPDWFEIETLSGKELDLNEIVEAEIG